MSAVKKYWKKPDSTLTGIILFLIGFGLVAVSSASAVLSYQNYGYTRHFFIRQAIYAAVGLVFLYVMSCVDYHVFRRWSRTILLVSALALALVLVPGIGFSVGPARSWFNAGWFFVQPSEFAKIAIIIYIAAWFDRKKDAETNFWFGLVPVLLTVGAIVGLTLMEGDVGTSTMMALIICVMLFAAGARWQYLGGLAGIGGLALWFLVRLSPSRAARFVTFLDPSLDPRGIGYHINQALLAIGSGGFWGYGFGASRQKHNYLPEPIGDSIFAVIAEELGFVRVVIVIVLFCLLAMRGVVIGRAAPDRFGQLLAVGIVGWIGLQALVNIAALLNLMPLTGITLPFISYGGSSMVAACIGAGILLNISRQRE